MNDTIAPSLPIHVRGDFSLREAVMFGFGHRHLTTYDGVMRLAFCLDDLSGPGAAEVRQTTPDRVEVTVVVGEPERVVGQVARILSLDHDGAAYADVGGHDPVIGQLQRERPGLRPPLFHSPYEAAAWSVISARRSGLQMAAVRDRLCREHGTVVELAGEGVAAFPTPDQLRRVTSFPGLDAVKISRLQAVADAASDGLLDVDRLRSIGADAATIEVQRIPGIGPFYATLIVVRSVGFADVLATTEPRLSAAVGERYGLGHPASPDELAAVAESWRPFRTWASVLIRASS